MSYIERVARDIRDRVPADALPEGDVDELFLIYAAVGLAKGEGVTARDVHNAWSAWMASRDPSHESIRPYDELDPETRREDDPFVLAIRSAVASSAQP